MPRTSDEKIALMHKEYGVLTGIQCRTCPHLAAHCNPDCTRIWYKCRLFGESSGTGTDWRASNTACGGFRIEPRQAKREGLYGAVYRRVKGREKSEPDEQLPGQIMMEL